MSANEPSPADDRPEELDSVARLRQRIAEQAREIRHLKELSDTDAVTGIANRRRFDEELRRCIAEFHRLDRGFAIVLIDIDQFKLINDGLGHPAGDRVLLTLAQGLRQFSRATDFVARIGGDEFALILPGVDVAEANAIVERIRQVTLSLLEAVIGESRGGNSHTALPVGWSAGVAVMSREMLAEQLIAAADQAMYVEKQQKQQKSP